MELPSNAVIAFSNVPGGCFKVVKKHGPISSHAERRAVDHRAF